MRICHFATFAYNWFETRLLRVADDGWQMEHLPPPDAMAVLAERVQPQEWNLNCLFKPVELFVQPPETT